MKKIIVKDNALIEASHKLNEVEQRLILLAIIKARAYCDSVEKLKGHELTIHASDYMNHFFVEKQTAYRALQAAVRGLFEAEWRYRYINGKGNVVIAHERFIQSAKYIENEGCIKFTFANAIIPMLVELENNFTSYDIRQIAKLSSRYAMRLYEFLMRFKDKKILKISLDDLRFRFGLLEHEYSRMSDFKKDVLELAIRQINAETNIAIEYEQHKQGRAIVGFTFSFQYKLPEHILSEMPLNQEISQQTEAENPFAGLTDWERQVIQAAIVSYIASLEEKGVEVGEFQRKNIINKAISERWNVDLAAKQQQKHQMAQERQAQELAEQKSKEQKNEQLRIERENLIAVFECLPAAQQNHILLEVEKETKRMGLSFNVVFQKAKTENNAHKHPMFLSLFKAQLQDLLPKSE